MTTFADWIRIAYVSVTLHPIHGTMQCSLHMQQTVEKSLGYEDRCSRDVLVSDSIQATEQLHVQRPVEQCLAYERTYTAGTHSSITVFKPPSSFRADPVSTSATQSSKGPLAGPPASPAPRDTHNCVCNHALEQLRM